MQTSNVYEWIKQNENRKKIVMSLTQPMTAQQICRRIGIGRDTCSSTLSTLADKDVVRCLTPTARSSRLYWLTSLGIDANEYLNKGTAPIPPKVQQDDIDSVNWELYGWVCYRHRSAIVRILTEPMQPSEIKRRLRQYNPDIRISANNVRDIIRLFHKEGIANKVFARKKAHPRYELTNIGIKFRELLASADMPMRFQ